MSNFHLGHPDLLFLVNMQTKEVQPTKLHKLIKSGIGIFLLFRCCPDPEDQDYQEVVCFPKVVLYNSDSEYSGLYLAGGGGGLLPQRFHKVTTMLLEVSSLPPPPPVIRENILALPPCSKIARYGAGICT